MKCQSAAVNSAVKNTPPRPRDRAARAKKHGIKGRQTTKRKREESHCRRLFPAAHPKQNLRATIPSDRTPSRFGTGRRFGASTYGSYRSAWRIGHYTDEYLQSRYPKRRRRVASAIRQMLIFGKVSHPRRSNRAATSPFHSVSDARGLTERWNASDPAGSNNCPTF